MSEIISDLQIIEKPDDFTKFAKIARLRRECAVTEKLNGANGQIYIAHESSLHPGSHPRFWVGSRNRWIHPKGEDNFGFAAWCHEHKQELIEGLGEGRHYGEWVGHGIQCSYNLKERRFYLFNTMRWSQSVPPPCCHVVPTIATGIFSDELIESAIAKLKEHGSYISEGFKPEGICIFHADAKTYFKYTFDGDGYKGAKK